MDPLTTIQDRPTTGHEGLGQAERDTYQVLSEGEAVAILEGMTPQLHDLGVQRLRFVGFEAPWEWRLEPAMRVAVAYDKDDLDTRFGILFFLQDSFGREVHLTRLKAGRPEPDGIEINGLE